MAFSSAVLPFTETTLAVHCVMLLVSNELSFPPYSAADKLRTLMYGRVPRPGPVERPLRLPEQPPVGRHNTCLSCIHAADLLRFGITCMSVLFKYSELFFEFVTYFLNARKDLFVFVMKP